jgi:hypothetical protein
MDRFHKALGKPMKPKKPLHSEKTSFGGKVHFIFTSSFVPFNLANE